MTGELGDAQEAAALVGPHDVAVVLGSGWQGVAGGLGSVEMSWPMHEVPGFLPPAVDGHPGVVHSVLTAAGARVLLLVGRTHLYEGHGVGPVVHGVRMAGAAGCRSVVLTNAAGAVNADYAVGDLVLIRDHLNLTGVSPLVGPTFVDLTECWSPRLREVAAGVEPAVPQGVYAAMGGPQYETPAEIRMLRTLGADLVGMSTVCEAIAARAAGLEVLGISLVTNMAAGVSDGPLDHGEVLAAGASSAPRLQALLTGILTAT